MQDISQWKEEFILETRAEFLRFYLKLPYRSDTKYPDIEIANWWLSKFDTFHHKAITEERERIVKALIEQAEPYENSKWHNQLSIETIKKIISNE